MASGRGPHGLGLLRRLTRGFGSGAGTGARPRHTNAPALTPPLRLPIPPEKVSRCASPRRQGVHSPPKGSPCRAEACTRARRATSHLPASPRPESPQPLTWPWQRARAEDRGWPSPRRGSSHHPQSGSQRRAPLAPPPSSEVLAPPVAGVSLAGKLAARSVPRGGARRRPPRPEADSSGAAPPASPEAPRRGPPAPPPPPPRLSVFRRLGAREGPSGLLGPPGVEWAHGSLLTLRERPHPVWSPQPSVLAPPFPNSAAPVMRVATEGRGGRGCVEGVFWEGGLPPGAADARSQEEK